MQCHLFTESMWFYVISCYFRSYSLIFVRSFWKLVKEYAKLTKRRWCNFAHNFLYICSNEKKKLNRLQKFDFLHKAESLGKRANSSQFPYANFIGICYKYYYSRKYWCHQRSLMLNEQKNPFNILHAFKSVNVIICFQEKTFLMISLEWNENNRKWLFKWLFQVNHLLTLNWSKSNEVRTLWIEVCVAIYSKWFKSKSIWYVSK